MANQTTGAPVNDPAAYVNRTYRLSRPTANRIKALAVKHELWDSSLADWLLSEALNAVDAGRLVIRRRPASYVIDTAG
jgi:hypothetical protein